MASKKKSPRDNTSDLTVRILTEIRDELRETATALRAEVAQVSERLDRLEQRQTEADVRVATELTAVATALNDIKAIVLDIRDDRARMNAFEVRLARLESKAS